MTACCASWTAAAKCWKRVWSPSRYREIIGEAVEPWTYLKFPYYKPYAVSGSSYYRMGMYRVGPLARLNICDYAGTPKADEELRAFRQLASHGKPVNSAFHYHYARLIEILFSLEKIAETLEDPNILDEYVRSRADVNQTVGVGVSEAPRGTLFHEYHVNHDGIIQKVNLIIATGQNNLAMNRTVQQIAKHHINGGKLTRRRPEPHGARHPSLRPVPELLDPRRGLDAAACAACVARWKRNR